MGFVWRTLVWIDLALIGDDGYEYGQQVREGVEKLAGFTTTLTHSQISTSVFRRTLHRWMNDGGRIDGCPTKIVNAVLTIIFPITCLPCFFFLWFTS